MPLCMTKGELCDQCSYCHYKSTSMQWSAVRNYILCGIEGHAIFNCNLYSCFMFWNESCKSIEIGQNICSCESIFACSSINYMCAMHFVCIVQQILVIFYCICPKHCFVMIAFLYLYKIYSCYNSRIYPPLMERFLLLFEWNIVSALTSLFSPDFLSRKIFSMLRTVCWWAGLIQLLWLLISLI